MFDIKKQKDEEENTRRRRRRNNEVDKQEGEDEEENTRRRRRSTNNVNKQEEYEDGSPRRRRRMVKFKMTEISAVDRPAQAPALSVLMKRNDDSEDVQKNGDLVDVLTSEEEGHQHGVSYSIYDGQLYLNVGYATSEGAERGHDHAITVNAEGEYVVSTNDGHSHTISTEEMRNVMFSQLNKSYDKVTANDLIKSLKTPGEHVMPKNVEDLEKSLGKMKTQLAKSIAFGLLTDFTKAHYATLSETGKDAFLTKSSAEQHHEAKEAQDADEVVYKSLDGTEFRKSSDTALVEAIKRSDQLAKRLDVELENRANESFIKRANEDLKHMPGDVNARAAVLKAVDAIEDEEVRKSAHEMLKAQNANMAKAFETNGFKKGVVGGDADANSQLDDLAKAHAAAHGVPYSKAYTAVLDTVEGQALYEQSIGQ